MFVTLFRVEHVITLKTFHKLFGQFDVLFNASQYINKHKCRFSASAMNLTCGFGNAKLRGEVTPKVCLPVVVFNFNRAKTRLHFV